MKDKIIYQLTNQDIQTVAREEIGREVTEEEARMLEEIIAEKINWFEIIADAINQKLTSGKMGNKL